MCFGWTNKISQGSLCWDCRGKKWLLLAPYGGSVLSSLLLFGVNGKRPHFRSRGFGPCRCRVPLMSWEHAVEDSVWIQWGRVCYNKSINTQSAVFDANAFHLLFCLFLRFSTIFFHGGGEDSSRGPKRQWLGSKGTARVHRLRRVSLSVFFTVFTVISPLLWIKFFYAFDLFFWKKFSVLILFFVPERCAFVPWNERWGCTMPRLDQTDGLRQMHVQLFGEKTLSRALWANYCLHSARIGVVGSEKIWPTRRMQDRPPTDVWSYCG